MATLNVLIGIPGKSNAFAISKRLGLSDKILDKAKEQLNKDIEMINSGVKLQSVDKYLLFVINVY